MMWEERADIVETAYLAQGMLCAREYFTRNNDVYKKIVQISDSFWKNIDWSFFLNGTDKLHWHWSSVDGFNTTFLLSDIMKHKLFIYWQ